jgi:hypothetical protein
MANEKQSAVARAAVAALTAAAAYGLKHALTDRDGLLARLDSDDQEDGDREGLTETAPLLATVWNLASHTLLPMAEEAAAAAGRWVAEEAPDVIRDRLVRPFIQAFNDRIS